ncbi:hypothetical protein CcrBL47_gp494 [Caulobacter phage BL47]|nr:hypothetical protein CcrBL47_gp494 [Caulobacter phage BL47]UTU10332.1 hypothetical protein CcrRB23_gp470 [Caulobacter phage RB23]
MQSPFEPMHWTISPKALEADRAEFAALPPAIRARFDRFQRAMGWPTSAEIEASLADPPPLSL